MVAKPLSALLALSLLAPLSSVAAQPSAQTAQPDQVSCPVGPAITLISAIQGSGPEAAITGDVTIAGIVTIDLEGSGAGFRGFFVQEEDSDADADPATAEGIFVFNGTNDSVSVGDLVQISGTAGEFSGQTQLSNPAITVCGQVGTAGITPVEVTFPVASVSDLERYEGMLVRMPQDLTITEYFNFDRFGELVLALPPTIDGNQAGRPIQPTNLYLPGSTEAISLADLQLRSRITLDDASNAQNPAVLRHPNGEPFTTTNFFRGGDTVSNTVGVLEFRFGGYRIQPTAPAGYAAVNPRPTSAPVQAGTMRVVGFNVLNYFSTVDGGPDVCGPNQDQDCRGADDVTDFAGRSELERQQAKLISALVALDADVVGLIEIENTTGVTPTAEIVGLLNAELGAGTYDYIDTGVIGSDAIRVGLIYKPASAEPIGDFAILDSTTAVSGTTFDDTRSRPVLIQTFAQRSNGERVTVAVNHLKSKGASGLDALCNPAYYDPNCDQSDGQGYWNATRREAAVALASYLATDPTGSGDPDFLIIGDLNAYAKEDPVQALEGRDYTNLIPRFGGPLSYSYVFDGLWGSLDHALASSSLLGQVAFASDWHVNSDEQDVFDYDASFKPAEQEAIYEVNPFRTSDHDPVVVDLTLGSENPNPLIGAVANYDTGEGEDNAEIISFNAATDRAVLTAGAGGFVDVLDTSDLFNIRNLLRVEGLGGVTSASIHPTQPYFLAVNGGAQPASAPISGTIYAYSTVDGTLITSATVGIQPDSVVISPDGTRAIVANEAESCVAGENNDACTTANDGGVASISVVDLAGLNNGGNELTITNVALPDLSGLAGATTGQTSSTAAGVPIDNTPATLEPEGIAFAGSDAAFIALQENNIIIRLDLSDNSIQAFGLGTTTHIADTNNDDGIYQPNTTITAFRQPDGISVVEVDGRLLVVTPDEGDSEGPSGDNGARTLSIFEYTGGASPTLTLLSDTGNQLDALAARFGKYDDGRSDNRGTEPEISDSIVFNGRTIAVVGLERADSGSNPYRGGVAVVDISDPSAPNALTLLPTDRRPEGVKLIVRDGALYAISANERQGTVSVNRVPVGSEIATQGYRPNQATPIVDLFALAPGASNVSLSISLGVAGATINGAPTVVLTGTPAEVNATAANLALTAGAGLGDFSAAVTLTQGAVEVTGTLRFRELAVSAPVAQIESARRGGPGSSFVIGGAGFIGSVGLVQAGQPVSITVNGVLVADNVPTSALGSFRVGLLTTATTPSGVYEVVVRQGSTIVSAETFEIVDGAAVVSPVLPALRFALPETVVAQPFTQRLPMIFFDAPAAPPAGQ